MACIALTRGLVALVDDEDFGWLSKVRWQAKVRSDGRAYAFRSAYQPRETIYMHRLICGAALVDHINRDGLDNRRANLRPCTVGQNNANRCYPRSPSGFRGVAPPRGASRRWEAYAHRAGRRITIGRYLTPEEAARARDAVARELHGAFAVLNFPEAA